MTFFMILIPTVCYFAAGVSEFKNKDFPMSLVFVSYGMANIGLMWYELAKKAHG